MTLATFLAGLAFALLVVTRAGWLPFLAVLALVVAVGLWALLSGR